MANEDVHPTTRRVHKGLRERRLLAAHEGQRISWRLTDGEDHPVTVTKPLDALRPIDYNGCMPLTFDEDGNPENDSDPDAGQYE